MAYGDFKDLAKHGKYDGYQRRLASIFYKCFDKKSSVGGIKSMPQNEQLAEELHKPIFRECF